MFVTERLMILVSATQNGKLPRLPHGAEMNGIVVCLSALPFLHWLSRMSFFVMSNYIYVCIYVC